MVVMHLMKRFIKSDNKANFQRSFRVPFPFILCHSISCKKENILFSETSFRSECLVDKTGSTAKQNSKSLIQWD